MQLVEFKAIFPAILKKKKKHWVARCPVLDVLSQGETKTKALDNLSEAVQVFLTSCFERGVLDEVLRDLGFKSKAEVKRTARVTPLPKRKFEYIEVPLPLLAASHHSRLSNCHE